MKACRYWGPIFIFLSRPTGTVSRLFGVYDGASGLALRGTFIINPQGKLVTSEVNFYNVGRDAAELPRGDLDVVGPERRQDFAICRITCTVMPLHRRTKR